MPQSLAVTLADHNWLLLADRGLYWPLQETLFVADTHFGKEATFRAGGIPVPRGSTDATLARITRMLGSTGAPHLVILGDMFHTRESLSDDVCQSIERFCASHDGLTITLVVGNHDRHVGTLPGGWPIAVTAPGKVVDSVMLNHQPARISRPARLQLCGHVHPAIRLSRHHDSPGPLPCFFCRGNRMVLPAVGTFTGVHCVRPRRDDHVWMIVDDDIVAAPKPRDAVAENS